MGSILEYNNNNKNILNKNTNSQIEKNDILNTSVEFKDKESYLNGNKNNQVDIPSNIKNIAFIKNIINRAYSFHFQIDNTFIIFWSINKILYLIYSSEQKSIISYNLIAEQIINEIKNPHTYISNFRHFLDKINKRDLIISVSKYDKNIKLWNVYNFECLLELKNINNKGDINSACFLHDNNQIYIITSNYNKTLDLIDPIKIFDFKGNTIKEINNSKDNIYFIDTYYDNKLSKNFIITGCEHYVKSYDYDKNEIYHKYPNENKSAYHGVIINNYKNEIIKLIGPSTDGYIRIWNFHSSELIKKIPIIENLPQNIISNISIYGVCLFNDNYLVVGVYEDFIHIIDLEKGIIVKKLYGTYIRGMVTIKKIIHPKYGECIISQGEYLNSIKLWGQKYL